MSHEHACKLCGLDVGTKPFTLRVKSGMLVFCCEGCLGIYQLLHEDELVTGDGSAPNLKENQGG